MPKMHGRLVSVEAENFRSLRRVTVPLGPLNVMVGPNGAGKTNLLDLFRFLADIIHTDLEPALERRGGFDRLVFCGGEEPPESIVVRVTAAWTAGSSQDHPDSYELNVVRLPEGLARREVIEYPLADGRRQRVTASGQSLTVVTISPSGDELTEQEIGISRLSSAISTLPRLTHTWGGEEISLIAHFLSSLRAFEVRVDEARRPSRFPHAEGEVLREDSSNLASFLFSLRERDADAWSRLVADAMEVLPQLDGVDFEQLSGAAREVIAVLRERGLRRSMQLADASYGTIRLLGLLALLYDPDPPAFTALEEIDHGLHPQALELLVERLREASERTQFLIATHSPALADRLTPEELIVCERADDGSSVIPAVSAEEIERIVEESERLNLGELWFSGALGGDL